MTEPATAAPGPLTMDEYARRAAETAVYPPDLGLLYTLLGLLGEAGELADVLAMVADPVPERSPLQAEVYAAASALAGAASRLQAVKKRVRDQGLSGDDLVAAVSLESSLQSGMARGRVFGEAADCLWYLSELAGRAGGGLAAMAGANLQKLEGRKARGTIGGSGEGR